MNKVKVPSFNEFLNESQSPNPIHKDFKKVWNKIKSKYKNAEYEFDSYNSIYGDKVYMINGVGNSKTDITFFYSDGNDPGFSVFHNKTSDTFVHQSFDVKEILDAITKAIAEL